MTLTAGDKVLLIGTLASLFAWLWFVARPRVKK